MLFSRFFLPNSVKNEIAFSFVSLIFGLSSFFLVLELGINSFWTDYDVDQYNIDNTIGDIYGVRKIETEHGRSIIGELGLRVYLGGSED